MTLAQIRQRIEKGCGEMYVKKLPVMFGEELIEENEYCLYCKDEKYGLCPSCLAQLKLLSEIEGEMKNTWLNTEERARVSLNQPQFDGCIVDAQRHLKQKLLGVKEK